MQIRMTRRRLGASAAAFAALPQTPQHLGAIALRQVDVENDQIGTGKRGIRIGAIEPAHRVLTVMDDAHIGRDMRHCDGFADQEHVCLVVFDNQNLRQGWGGGMFRSGG